MESFLRTVFTEQKGLAQEEGLQSSESRDTAVEGGSNVNSLFLPPRTVQLRSPWPELRESLPFVSHHALGVCLPCQDDLIAEVRQALPALSGEPALTQQGPNTSGSAGGQNSLGDPGPLGFGCCCCHYFKTKDQKG